MGMAPHVPVPHEIRNAFDISCMGALGILIAIRIDWGSMPGHPPISEDADWVLLRIFLMLIFVAWVMMRIMGHPS